MFISVPLERLTRLASVAILLTMANLTSTAQAQAEGWFVVGGVVGQDSYKLTLKDDDFKSSLGKFSGFGGGITGGYEFDFSNWRLAFEGEFILGGADKTIPFIVDMEEFSADIKAKRSLGFAARFGYTFDGSFLVYGRFGWTSTKMRLAITGPGVDTSDKSSVSGLSYGGGVEFPVSDYVSIRAEYVRTNHGKIKNQPLKVRGRSIRGGLVLRY